MTVTRELNAMSLRGMLTHVSLVKQNRLLTHEDIQALRTTSKAATRPCFEVNRYAQWLMEDEELL